jgi:hypothetical protein
MKEVIPLSDSYLMQLELEGIGLSFLQENVRPYSSLEKLVCLLSFLLLPRLLDIIHPDL